MLKLAFRFTLCFLLLTFTTTVGWAQVEPPEEPATDGADDAVGGDSTVADTAEDATDGDSSTTDTPEEGTGSDDSATDTADDGTGGEECFDTPIEAACDTDSDGVIDTFDNCTGGANGAATLPSPAIDWAQTQRDLNADGFSDIDEIVAVAGAFGRQGGNPAATAGYEGRLDLNYDRFIDIDDIVLVAGVFGRAC